SKSKDSESISIAETNKIRLALGLKPLKSDTGSSAAGLNESSYDSQERQAVENWKKHNEELKRKEAKEKKLEAIKKAKESAQRYSKLEGKGLAEDEEDEDAATWLRKQKKRQKKLAERMAKELAAREEEEAKVRKEYTAADVAGLRVGHDLADLEENENGTILTLKDT